MSITAIVEALVSAGATPEMILAAVRAAEQSQDDALAARRANDAERARRYRERHVTSRDVTVTERDDETGSCDASLSKEVLVTSYQKDPLKGVQKGKVSDEDVAAGQEAVAVIAGLRAIPDHAFTAHQSIMAALAEAGFHVVKEVQVEAEGDSGRVDVVATKAGGTVAIEIDSRSVRQKSIRKLRRMAAYRIAALRRPVVGEEIEGIHAVVGIDTVSGTSWARGSRLPEDWKPGERELEYARNAGLTDAQVEKEATKFLRHWVTTPGAKGVKLNWFTTWQNWVDRAVEFLGVKKPDQAAPATPQFKTHEEAQAWWVARHAERKAAQ